jgi:hypothetical protein
VNSDFSRNWLFHLVDEVTPEGQAGWLVEVNKPAAMHSTKSALQTVDFQQLV